MQRGSANITNLDLVGLQGLAEQEARLRLEAEGANKLPSQKERGIVAIACDVKHQIGLRA